MGDTTEISWCDKTFNPWVGCTKVSPACQHCYAERDFDHRYKKVQWGPTGTRVITSDANWRKPIAWNKEAKSHGVRYRVFCASLADVFESWDGPIRNSDGHVLSDLFEPASNSDMHNDELLPMEDVRYRLFELIDSTPYLDWLLLTKRPENIAGMWWGHTKTGFRPCHRDNVWLGTSVENSDYLHRIDTLKACGDVAGKLFLSIEPLLGALPTLGEHIDGIDWVIVGGESGPNSRPMNPDWVRSIRDQCETHGVAFHLKQWGEWVPYEHRGSPPLIESQHGFNFDSHGLPPDIINHEPVDGWYWPDGLSDVVYRKVGKTIAGRKLDEVTHDAFP